MTLTVSDTSTDGPHGAVPLGVYRPTATPAQPTTALLWVHGGGFVGGTIDMPESDWFARQVVATTSAIIVTVGYRLVGQGCHYPVPSDDVLAAWNWMCLTAGLGRSDRRFIGGASAAGNLATGVALRCAPDIRPAGLLLAYPTLHAVQPGYAGGPWGWSPAEILDMYSNYVGGDPTSAPSTAIPGIATSAELTTLPSTWIVTSENDGLRPSGEHFAAQLRDATVPVRVRRAPVTGHGHLNDPGDPGAAPSIRFLSEPLNP